MTHFADRLIAAVRGKRNAVCVGLDPRWEALPQSLRARHGDDSLAAVAAAFEEFCARVIDVVAPLVAVVKPQAAFFEACGPAGMGALQRVLRRARQHGLLTILDGKRNDVGSTATAYAEAAFGGVTVAGRQHPVWDADALTVNPYLGRDAVEPFLQSARRSAGGVFVLVRTSNPGARQFQDLDCDGRPLFLHVGAAVNAWAGEHLGQNGFGDVGAVAGATFPQEMAVLRSAMPYVFFLVPGYGAQGATAADTAPAFRPDGLGAIVNSSRGIIASFAVDDPAWEARVESATRDTITALAQATPMGRLAASSA
jgi:orotidine-5'-phosphate decarboxylase